MRQLMPQLTPAIAFNISYDIPAYQIRQSPRPRPPRYRNNAATYLSWYFTFGYVTLPAQQHLLHAFFFDTSDLILPWSSCYRSFISLASALLDGLKCWLRLGEWYFDDTRHIYTCQTPIIYFSALTAYFHYASALATMILRPQYAFDDTRWMLTLMYPTIPSNFRPTIIRLKFATLRQRTITVLSFA